jgi:hypothetical protein
LRAGACGEVRFGVVVLMAVRWGLSHVSLHVFHM